jgi:hypothetical protein
VVGCDRRGGFYQRCGWRICEAVDRAFEPATVLTKQPRAEPMECIAMPVQASSCGPGLASSVAVGV